ncbi:MAG: aminotransferase class V-fold PLP-dependent enzyme [Gemmatimonadaceae bacterium]|nr:aminotransferase class V-fold PLP-dependent enzyme [Gemmatimonadaceae bacterium]
MTTSLMHDLVPAFAAARTIEYPWMDDAGAATYLDHASTGAIPRRGAAALERYARLRHRPQELQAEHFFPVLARSRELAARLIGASAREIALTTNTTHGLNLAAFALPLEAGDVVLMPDGEFPANVFPWLVRARRTGATVVRLPLVDGVPEEAALLQAIATHPRVRGVAVSWVSFWSGARLDLAAIGAACRARGAWFTVDAIQGLGALPLDVKAAGIDVLACGAQKWLQSPWGTAFAYVRDELVTQLEPPVVGWMATEGSEDLGAMCHYREDWFGDARRFEQITLPMQDFAAMNESLALFLELDPHAVAAHIAALGDQAVAWVDAHPHVRLVTPRARAQRAGVLAFVPPDVAGTSARLRAAGVMHSVREGCVRLSPHWYTTPAAFARALDLLDA